MRRSVRSAAHRVPTAGAQSFCMQKALKRYLIGLFWGDRFGRNGTDGRTSVWAGVAHCQLYGQRHDRFTASLDVTRQRDSGEAAPQAESGIAGGRMVTVEQTIGRSRRIRLWVEPHQPAFPIIHHSGAPVGGLGLSAPSAELPRLAIAALKTW
jgi:hypothetical protein